MSQVTNSGSSSPAANLKHEQARQQIQKLLERDKDKDAYSQAKALYRLDNSPATRALLEQAYLLRLQSLVRAGMPAAAKEIAIGLLALGVTNEKIVESLVMLLPQIGLGDRAAQLSGRLGSPEAQARLALALADQAVLKPENASPLSGELRETARKVRDALAAVLADNEASAAEMLEGIPRQSPFADWKLLSRGLSAYYREDLEQTRANWDRLQVGRAPHAIAAALLRNLPPTADTSPANGSSTAAPPTATNANAGGMARPFHSTRLETQVFGEPVIAHLDELRKALAEADLKRALQVLKIIYGSFRRTGLELGPRLTAIVLDRFVEVAIGLAPAEGERLVREFTKTADPLPIDPHWNRLWANIWSRAGGRYERSPEFWQAYLADIDGLSAESVERRQLMKALVWEELGDIRADECNELPPPYVRDVDDLKPDYGKAVAAYEESLKCRPLGKSAFTKIASLYKQHPNGPASLDIARRMFVTFPNDFDAVTAAFQAAAQADDASLLLEAALQSRRLKPLDPNTQANERYARGVRARHLALAKRWDEARQELAIASDLCTTTLSHGLVAAKKAAVEFKAGKTVAAEQLVQQGAAIFTEAPFWLAMSIESERYRLSKVLQKKCSAALKTALGRKKVGTTASLLAELIMNSQTWGVSYPSGKKHLEQVTQYVLKCSRTKFAEAELESVVALLSAGFPDGDKPYRFVCRGVRAYPKSAFFHYYMGRARMLPRGPYTGPDFRSALRSFELAATLAARPGDPHASLLPEIRRLTNELSNPALTNQLEDLFRFAMGANFDEDDLDDDEDDLDDAAFIPEANDFFQFFSR